MTASSEEMAPRERTRYPPTSHLGKSYVTSAMIQEMEKRGILQAGLARAPLLGETSANLNLDKGIVFRDFVTTGL